MESHLEVDEAPNRKNGFAKETIKSPSGSFELETPRDRAGTFEPQLIKKHQTHLTGELERKIISMFGLGMSYQDITSHVAELYGLDVSNATISAITDIADPGTEGVAAAPTGKPQSVCLAGCHPLQDQRRRALRQQSHLYRTGPEPGGEERDSRSLRLRE